MLLSAMIYVFGFLLEIISDTVPEYHMAVIVEYFGEMILMVGLSLFVKLLCHVYMPSFVYAFETVAGILVMYALITTEKNHFFYREISADNSGPVSILRLSYGPGFYLAISYIGMICMLAIIACIFLIRTGNKMDRKRGVYTICGMLLIWSPYFLKITGLTGGYEIPGVGISLAAIVFYLILVRYAFLDSVTLASENALDHGKEGIIVYTPDYRVEYFNKKMESIFGKIPNRIDVKNKVLLGDIVTGRIEHYKIKGRIYDFERQELRDKDVLQGYMLWVLDSTEHFETLEKMREIAIKDPLTKLYNRVFFQNLVEEQLEAGCRGAFCMFDMDNFKQVNDNYGHQAGDAVLNAFADLLKEYGEQKLIGCRIGGDEFAAFMPEEANKKQVGELLEHIMGQFQNKLSDLKLEGLCSISAGAVLCATKGQKEVQFKNLYSKADSILYEAKKAGKNCYVIHSF
jgi:diguanylate cyclase (GGDEF)-like protein